MVPHGSTVLKPAGQLKTVSLSLFIQLIHLNIDRSTLQLESVSGCLEKISEKRLGDLSELSENFAVDAAK
jgi:hypothetical protein